LIDPVTDQVRYIGKADNVIQRYRQHLCTKKRKFPVHHWIESLASPPLVATLSPVAKNDWEEAECLWIEFYRRQGAPLLNLTAGGNAPVNPYQQTGKRAELGRLKHRLSLLLRDKYLTEKSKERIRNKMRWMYKKHPSLFENWAHI
jgi:hypothetical protein